MLNILESGRRKEKRERAEAWKDYIVLSNILRIKFL
jgi:hypothetical protein